MALVISEPYTHSTGTPQYSDIDSLTYSRPSSSPWKILYTYMDSSPSPPLMEEWLIRKALSPEGNLSASVSILCMISRLRIFPIADSARVWLLSNCWRMDLSIQNSRKLSMTKRLVRKIRHSLTKMVCTWYLTQAMK